jgi:hypothetical protein
MAKCFGELGESNEGNSLEEDKRDAPSVDDR